MMTANEIRNCGFIAGMLTVIAAHGVNWLITPMSHPDASMLRMIAVVVQVFVCGVLAIWFWRRPGRSVSQKPASS